MYAAEDVCRNVCVRGTEEDIVWSNAFRTYLQNFDKDWAQGLCVCVCVCVSPCR